MASPYPRGHHRAGCSTVTSTTAAEALAATRPTSSCVAQAHQCTVSSAAGEPIPDRSTSTYTATVAVAWSLDTVTSGRTDAIRATRQRSTVTGCQRPAVCRSGPQSHPKLHAILRTMFSGCG